MILIAHVVVASVWLGCVLTEVFFERALLAGDRYAHARLAELHLKVDALIEGPAFIATLLTGIVLFRQPAALNVAQQVMVGAGLVAVVANAACVWLVYARAICARSARWSEFDRLDQQQHRWGTVVLLGLLTALVAGVLA